MDETEIKLSQPLTIVIGKSRKQTLCEKIKELIRKNAGEKTDHIKDSNKVYLILNGVSEENFHIDVQNLDEYNQIYLENDGKIYFVKEREDGIEEIQLEELINDKYELIMTNAIERALKDYFKAINKIAELESQL